MSGLVERRPVPRRGFRCECCPPAALHTRSSDNKPGGLTHHLPALAAVNPPELIDQPCWSATELVNKSWLPAKLMRFEDVNPVTWAYLG